ncbi:MAG: relaxase domain-containing protein [Actinomycetota bacterium]|nr:relaxase domain-containing protein [Actinomycetota bacterium]
MAALTDAEYTVSAVAEGLEEYYLGHGEAPGVWAGAWAEELGLSGVVGHDELRALVDGLDPNTGTDLLAGRKARKDMAFDATFSAPKSVSLLWAFGSPQTSSVVVRAHVEAVEQALAFVEERAAVARQQVNRVRGRVATHGFAVASFVHRASREGDPQLHSHCVIPNIVRRPDGSFCAFDATPLHEWAKAGGSVYQEQLRRILSKELGVVWGPDRNGCREMAGFAEEQLAAFSKRSAQIEAWLEAHGARYESPVERMRADERASLATRRPKDPSLTPELLRERWAEEARAVGLGQGLELEAGVLRRLQPRPELSHEEITGALLDAETGLCARDARFGEAQVVERIAALGDGRLSVEEVVGHARAFLASEHVVRLTPDRAGLRSSPQWSTVAHRRLEDRVLAHLETLVGAEGAEVGLEHVRTAVIAEGRLGLDQRRAVAALCGPGPALRVLMGPAGFGKTATVHAAASASLSAGRGILGVATTNQAVSELRAVGIPATTIARLGMDLEGHRLASDTTVILDEVSQTSTADAATVLDAVVATPGAQLWCLGDPRQSPPVRAGGLAADLDALAIDGAVPAPRLGVNRRQLDALDQEALATLRAGEVTASQAMRTGAGWEQEAATPAATRQAMADAVVADVSRHGADKVVALAVSHGDCEDLADRIRARLAEAGQLSGPTITGAGWTGTRTYAAGDRVLLHASVGRGLDRVHNGTTATVTQVNKAGLVVRTDAGAELSLPRSFLEGRRSDATPKVSHAWARTIDGAQGGTFEQVHLLGSAALSHPSGYVGQSRSRLPTHTWNVARLLDGDHGGRLADDRSAPEAVAAAMARRPLATLAAADDPNVLDRELSRELAEHNAVLAHRPPDLSRELAQAREGLHRAEESHRAAVHRAAYARDRLEHHNPLARLRRDGRDDHVRRIEAMDRASADVREAREQMDACRARWGELELTQARRVAFDAAEGWREARAVEVSQALAHHWAEATLAVARQGDPLAFGTERLREARATYATDLDRLRARLPLDVSDRVRRAQAEVHRVERDRSDVLSQVEEAERALELASQRWWGRIDREARDNALRRHYWARSRLQGPDAAVELARQHLGQARADLARYEHALAATASERRELSQAVADLEAGLERTRPERVQVLARQEITAAYLVDALGPLPEGSGPRAVWCALAVEVEEFRDRHPGRGLHEDVSLWHEPGLHADQQQLHQLLARAGSLVAAGDQLSLDMDPLRELSPEGWAVQLEQAQELAPRLPEPALEQSLGMDLGW